MFKAKTVFVLGAGASAEVGLPVGEELKGIIAAKLDIRSDPNQGVNFGDERIKEAFWERDRLRGVVQNDINPYIHAAWRLRDALPLAISIDNLLDAHRDDELAKVCGKLGIVSSILEAERKSNLSFPAGERQRLVSGLAQGTWFARFLKLLTEGTDKNNVDSIFDNISIVSFNYDRCLEHYLHEVLQIYYALESNAITKIMARLKIFHPYGSVGKLPWQEQDQTLQVPYGAERYNLLELSKQIKTYNESVDENAEIEQIAHKIHEANIIVFLGFAFHEQNLNMLDPKANSMPKRVYATTSGISDSNCTIIMSAIGDLLKSNQHMMPAASDFRKKFKCVDLLNEYSRSLTSP